MPPRVDFRAGQVFREWTLVDVLGVGGNAEVWRATSAEGSPVALKILRRKGAEPYLRFRDEVGALQRLGDIPGIVPLIAAELPDEPSRAHPAWLAMSLATPILDAVGAQPEMEVVLEAMAAIALTLALLADQGVFHRDIKPANLYALENRWCVGDFGLVAFPGKESITAAGKHIGPIYYLAPEQLSGAAYAPGPADVFALAKTLWVLATGQNYPLPGTLESGAAQTRLSSFVEHERTRPIEVLLERATLLDPQRRPTMRDFAVELEAWRSGPVQPSPRSNALDRIANRIRGNIERHSSADARRLAQQEYVTRRIDAVQANEMRGLSDTLGSVLGVEVNRGALSVYHETGAVPDRRAIPGYSHQGFTSLCANIRRVEGASVEQIQLLCGIALTVLTDGQVRAHVTVAVVLGNDKKSVSKAEATFQMESAHEAMKIAELIQFLHDSLPEALAVVSDLLEQ